MAFDWIDLKDGRVRFSGMSRGSDEIGHDTFEIQLPTKPDLYGEYRAAWADNERDFSIEVVSFGYTNDRNVGNDHPDARYPFSNEERQKIERMAIALVLDSESQKGLPAFSLKGACFLGQVYFAPGWIVLNE